MKKIISLLILVAMLFASCNVDATNSSIKDETNNPAGKKDVMIIWTEPFSQQSIKDLVSYLHESTQGEFNAEVIALPDYEDENRDEELKRLRTELMSGKGPDLFILNAYSTLSSGSFLFPDIEKTMRAGVFQDLTAFFDESEEFSQFIEPVMQAGKLNSKRYVVPLQYHIYHYYGPKDKFENIDVNRAGENLFLFNEEFAKNPGLISSFAAPMPYTWFDKPFLDYDAGKLNIDKQVIENGVSANIMFRKTLEKSTEMSEIKLGFGYNNAGIDCEIVPKSNSTGTITPVIASYAMVFSSSKHTKQAVSFINLLLSETLQKNEPLIYNDKAFALAAKDSNQSLLFMQPNALPVRVGCNKEEKLSQLESRLTNGLLLGEGYGILDKEIRKAVDIALTDDFKINDLCDTLQKELGKFISE